jgi:predicted DNA-binding transcriptional regulator AlpA
MKTTKQINGPGTRLISKAEVLDRTGLSFPTIWKMMRENNFPQAMTLPTTPRVKFARPVWVESEVDAWIEALPRRTYKPADGKAA